MSLLPVTPDDLPALLAIQLAAFQSEAAQYGDCSVPPMRQTVEDLRADLATKTFLKAVDETGAIVGSIRASEKENVCYLEKLSVSPAHQQRGHGTALLLAVEKAHPHATSYRLFTGHLSESNIRLYQKLGYQTLRTEKISDRLTLLHMEKKAVPATRQDF